jgi:hypothetical protein
MHCHETSIYVFPEKDLRGLSPNFHIRVSVSDLYIPRISSPIFLLQNRQTDGGKYINRTHRHVNVEIGLRPRNSFSRNICFEFSVLSLCSVAIKNTFTSLLKKFSFFLKFLTELSCRAVAASPTWARTSGSRATWSRTSGARATWSRTSGRLLQAVVDC